MVRRLSLIAVFALCAPILFAGDVATFANLGFSGDGRIFMFGQYGVNRETSAPYAEIYTVDVPANDFVSNGVFRLQADRRVSAGQDGSAALYAVLRRASSIISTHSIDHLRQGRVVYALINDDEPEPRISFRDFETGYRYTAELSQQREGEGTDVKARFHIDLERVDPDGASRTYTIGLPDFYREGVSRYSIRQAILSPDEQAIVFVVEMERPTRTGTSIRYMVETVHFG